MTKTLSPNKTRHVIYALTMDSVLVVVFAISGRASHDEAAGIGGTVFTAWPFLVALLVAWLLTRSWRHPLRLWPQGVCLWLITLTGGMALRILAGSTAAPAFVIVATLFLAVVLLGHRLLAGFVVKKTTKT